MPISADPKNRMKTKKVFYGPSGDVSLFWRVKIRAATKRVVINGKLEHAIAGVKGSTIGCHLSNCATANARAFGHPVLFAVFTKRTCTIVTKVKDGVPAEGILYYHDYSDLVTLNDTDEFKKYIREHPELANRTFILSPPDTVVSQAPGRHDGEVSKPTGTKKAYAPRGALRRAVDAGLIAQPVAKIIEEAHKGADDPNTPSLVRARKTLQEMDQVFRQSVKKPEKVD